MGQSRNPGLPMIRHIANICAFAAILPLIYVGEWVPGLLPYSPTLAYSRDPAVNSITFPIISGALSLAGIATWLLLRRLHWAGLWTFAGFWLAVAVILLRLASAHQPLDYRTFFGLAVILAFPVALAFVLFKNWSIALRSNTSLERTREI
jgi:hypothetical protein